MRPPALIITQVNWTTTPSTIAPGRMHAGAAEEFAASAPFAG